MKRLAIGVLSALLAGCSGSGKDYSDATIYPAKVITMLGEDSVAEAVVVQGDEIIGVEIISYPLCDRAAA